MFYSIYVLFQIDRVLSTFVGAFNRNPDEPCLDKEEPINSQLEHQFDISLEIREDDGKVKFIVIKFFFLGTMKDKSSISFVEASLIFSTESSLFFFFLLSIYKMVIIGFFEYT